MPRLPSWTPDECFDEISLDVRPRPIPFHACMTHEREARSTLHGEGFRMSMVAVLHLGRVAGRSAPAGRAQARRCTPPTRIADTQGSPTLRGVHQPKAGGKLGPSAQSSATRPLSDCRNTHLTLPPPRARSTSRRERRPPRRRARPDKGVPRPRALRCRSPLEPLSSSRSSESGGWRLHP